MRKSFTRLFGLFMLFCTMSLFAVAQTLSPAQGSLAATNVDNRTGSVTLTMTFAGNMYPASGVGIIALSTATGVQLDPVQITGAISTNPTTGSTVTINGKVVTIKFVGNFIEGVTYEVTATNDALKDASNTTWGGIAFGNWSITIADYTNPIVALTAAPSVPKFTPRDGSTAVAVASDLEVEFSEAVDFGTGNIALYTADGNVVEIFELATDAGDFDNAPGVGKVSIDVSAGGKVLYINPTNPLVELQKYYVRIAPTAIHDVSLNTNAYAGINDNITWNFQAADLTAPTIAFTPNGGTDIQQGQTMKMTFSDNRTAAGLSFTLKKAGGALVANEDVTSLIVFKEDPNGGSAFTNDLATGGQIIANYTATNEITITFVGANKFKTGATYQMGVQANKFADDEGNLIALTTKTFTAGDFTAPITTANVYAEAAGTGAGHAALFDGNAKSSDLETTKIYFGVETDDVTTPVSGLGKVPCTINYVVQKTSLAAITSVATVQAGSVLTEITATGVAYTGKHEDFITTDKDGTTLASNTSYTIYYVITDNATVNNPSAVKTAVVITNDTEGPVVSTVKATNEGGSLVTFASNNADNIKYNSTVVITFDEDIDGVNAGDIVIKQTNLATARTLTAAQFTAVESASGVITITGNDAAASVTDGFVAATPSGWLSSATYSISIINGSSNKIYDVIVGGRGTVNATAAATYTMTIEDYMGPIPTFKSSGSAVALQSRTDVAKSDNIVVTFSEAPRNENGDLLTDANIKNYIQVRKGDATGVNVGGTDLNPSVSMTISGNVVTIDPNADFASETWYGVWVSTLIEDNDGTTGTKLNKYQDNVTDINGTSEFATFQAVDSQSPLITFNTRNNANTAFTTLVDVPVDAKPYIFLSEQVKTTIGGGISILDDNQIRSLIELRVGSATGEIINFNVIDVDATPNAVYGVANTGTVILIDPIDFPGTYNYTSQGTYYVSVTGLQDAAGNAVSGNTTFTVENTSVLETLSVTPEDGDDQIALSGNVKVTFDRTVVKNTVGGPYYLIIDRDGALPYDNTIDLSIAGVTISNNEVTIPYGTGAALDPVLLANTSYGIYMDASAFAASNNGALSSAVSAGSITFTSLDSQGPRVDLTLATSDVTPNEATNVPINDAKLMLDFDEQVFLGTGVINIKKMEVGVATTVATIDLASANFTWATGDNTKLYVNIPTTLEYSTKYAVEIPATAFKDEHNNAWEWIDSAPSPSAADDVYGNRDVSVTGFVGAYTLSTSVWDFQTVSDAAPTYDLTNCDPKQGEDDVDITTGITIAFSEPMKLNSGSYNLSIHDGASATPAAIQSIPLESTTLTWYDNNTKVKIANSVVVDLVVGHDYYINIDANAFVSETNQAIGALVSDNLPHGAATNWYFTTKDQTPPAIKSISYDPANDGTEVDLDANIVVEFTEEVLPVTNWATSVTVVPASGAGLGLTNSNYTLQSDGKTLIINPSVNLSQSMVYTLTLVNGQTKDGSTNTNVLETKVFTTEDTSAPVINTTSTYAAYSSSKVKASLNISDFTTVAGAANDIIVYYLVTADGAYTTANKPSVSQMEHASSINVETATATDLEIPDLAEATEYDIWIMAVDKSKNANKTAVTQVSESVNTMSTTDVTKPEISLLTPDNGEEYVNYGVSGITFKIKWSEQIALSGNGSTIVIRKMADNTLVTTINQGAMTVGSSGTGFTNNQLSFTVAAGLFADLTEYYLEMENGLVDDVYNTSVGAASADNRTDEVFIGNTKWSFKTADETKPILIANTVAAAGPVRLTPADGATKVSVDASNSLVMIFNEDIQKNTTTASNIYIYRVGVATPQEVIPVSSSDVSIASDNRTVTIARHNVYASESEFFVLVDANAFFDMAPVPNYYAGIAVQAGGGTSNNVTTANVAAELWNFETEDITAPVVVAAPSGTGVSTASAITFSFIDPYQGNIAEQIYEGSNAVLNTADKKAWFSATADGVAVSITSAVYDNTLHQFKVTLSTGAILKSTTDYVVSFNPPTNLVDDEGNAVPAATATFSTVDNASPTITYTPTNTSTTIVTDFDINGVVTIKFDKTIYNSNMLAVAGSTSPNANFTPTEADFATGNYVTYQASVSGAAVPFTTEIVTPGVEYKLHPTSKLSSLTKYKVVWVATRGAAQEVYDRVDLPSENKLDLTLVQRTVEFVTEDVVAPKVNVVAGVSQFLPLDNALASTTTAVKIGLDEQVKAGSTTDKIEIRYSNGQIFDDVSASACSYATGADANGTWWVTIPVKTLDKFKGYYVIIPNGAFVDVNSNEMPYAGIQNNTTWNFNTDDGTDPMAEYYPETGAYNIPVYSDLRLVMDEDIQVVAGKNLVIYYNNGDPGYDGNAVEIIPLNDPRVTISGSDAQNTKTDIVTINPNTTFDKLGTYYVRIDAGAMTDFASVPNPYAGINDNTTWYFTITDNTTPTAKLAEFYPLNGSATVEARPEIKLVFDIPVEAGTGNIELYEYYYEPSTYMWTEKRIEAFAVTSDIISGTVVTVTPSADLKDNTTYYILVDNGAITNTASSKDPWGGISDPFIWRFNTTDNTAPTVTADLDEATAITTNDFDVTLTFSEVVTGAAAGITVTGGTATITEETVGTEYKVSISAEDLATVIITADASIMDAASNALVETTFTYNVADNNGPTLTVDPADGSSIATNMFDVTLLFNEDVTGVDAAVSVSAGTVTVTGSGHEYTASINAPSSTDVVLTVANTVVDLASNAFAGATYTYTVTGDTDAPGLAVDGLSPANGATLADAHPAELVMTFDEDVIAGAGTLSIYNGATVEWSFDITDSAVSIDGNEVTITLANSLDKNTTYFVYVDAGFVTDAYDNAYAGISSPTAWTFTTADFVDGIDPVIGSLELKVYPNPFVNELRIDNASELSRIVITSMTGQKVREIVKPNSTIQTNELRSGVYFITMYVDDAVAKTERIVKR